MFKFRANLCFIFRIHKFLTVKNACYGRFLFKNRDFVSKKREITHFKHKLIKSKQLFEKCVLSLQQKKILMVKVYG